MMITKISIYTIFISYVCLQNLVNANEPAGCGGFVQISSNLAKTNKKTLDYSGITMKLLTLEGALKESTPCAPNGYYYLPVYDKGQFILRIDGPQGWSFSPRQVQVEINEHNKCHSSQSQGEDINFELTGFQVYGRVIGKNCDSNDKEGPAGVTVTLKSNDFEATTTTDNRGFYEFNNIFPGKYKIQASHPSWSFLKNSIEFELNWDNGAIKEDLIVSGYDITGRVITSTQEPIMGVDFLLYSDNVKQIDCPTTDIQLPADRKAPLCSARSDETGTFKLNNIPCGNYKLVPFYKGVQTTFDVNPTETTFIVKKGSVVLSDPFKVMGFSLNGRVVDSKGKGISGVSIRVDGKEKAVTDSNGMYKLDQLNSGTYNIDAHKEHIFFNGISSHRISPTTAVIPDITVKSYHVCGRILINQPPSGVSVSQRTLQLFDTNEKQIATKETDSTGNYCFEVAPGTYKISPIIDSKEKAAGLLLSPDFQRVTVDNEPLLDVIFSQARVTVSGRVKCVESPCDPSLSLSLISESSQTRVTTSLGVGGVSFVFRDVLPGKYKITIHKDSWCWSQDTVQVEVKTDDITNIEFVQSGYQLVANINHSAKVLIGLEGSSKKSHSLVEGINKICVEKPGVYAIQADSCYKFAVDSYKYETSSPKQVDLVVSQFLVKGTIEELHPEEKPASITVNVKLSGSSESTAVPLTPGSSTKDSRKYEYQHWAKLGDKLEIHPKSPKLLFYPKSHSITVTGDSCPHLIESFSARPGLFLKGQVKPSLANVAISVYLEDSTEKFAEVFTKQDGKYEIGPLYDDKKYTLIAEKEGYKFEQVENGFKAEKLGQVTVAVKDQETNSPVSGVLLSLSGYSYRSNNLTLESGSFSFKNMNPGQYFLRPLLKEYTFEPSSRSIEIADGADVEIELKATRVAFSCYGVVNSLNGEPEKLVTIEAVGTKGEYEETQSDSDGKFRIRGLVPGSTYQIGVKVGDGDRIERASPKSIEVKVEKKDITNADFIVFRRSAKYEISGTIETDSQWLSSLQLSLYKEDSATPIKTISVGPSPYFEFPYISKGSYRLRVITNLSPQIYRYNETELTVTIPGSSHLTIDFHPTLHSEAHDVASTPVITLLFFLFIILAFVYRQSIITYFTEKPKKVERTNDNSEWVPKQFINGQSPTSSRKSRR